MKTYTFAHMSVKGGGWAKGHSGHVRKEYKFFLRLPLAYLTTIDSRHPYFYTIPLVFIYLKAPGLQPHILCKTRTITLQTKGRTHTDEQLVVVQLKK